MTNANCLDLKKATFTPYKIIIKSKQNNTTINALDIDYISYIRPTILNHILGEPVRQFLIVLKSKLYGRNNFMLCIKYKDFIKIQEILHVRYIIT